MGKEGWWVVDYFEFGEGADLIERRLIKNENE
jgi:hypothetical protein